MPAAPPASRPIPPLRAGSAIVALLVGGALLSARWQLRDESALATPTWLLSFGLLLAATLALCARRGPRVLDGALLTLVAATPLALHSLACWGYPEFRLTGPGEHVDPHFFWVMANGYAALAAAPMLLLASALGVASTRRRVAEGVGLALLALAAIGLGALAQRYALGASLDRCTPGTLADCFPGERRVDLGALMRGGALGGMLVVWLLTGRSLRDAERREGARVARTLAVLGLALACVSDAAHIPPTEGYGPAPYGRVWRIAEAVLAAKQRSLFEMGACALLLARVWIGRRSAPAVSASGALVFGLAAVALVASLTLSVRWQVAFVDDALRAPEAYYPPHHRPVLPKIAAPRPAPTPVPWPFTAWLASPRETRLHVRLSDGDEPCATETRVWISGGATPETAERLTEDEALEFDADDGVPWFQVIHALDQAAEPRADFCYRVPAEASP